MIEKTIKLNELRKQLADKMIPLFGKYEVEGGTYVFKPSLAKMGQQLGFHSSHISRALAPQNPLTNKQYNTLIKVVEALVRQKNEFEKQIQSIKEKAVFKDDFEKKLKKRTEKFDKIIKQERLKSAFGGIAATGILLTIFYFNFLNPIAVDENDKYVENNKRVPINKKIEIGTQKHSTILDPSFEEREIGNYRDSWKNKHLGGLFQSTNTRVFDGKIAAKLPAQGNRIGYQAVRVLKNKEYVLSFYYTMRQAPIGSLTVSILKGRVNNREKIEAATIKSITVYDQSNFEAYKKSSLKFNSGDNSIISVYFTNEGVQCRLDAFNLEMLSGDEENNKLTD